MREGELATRLEDASLVMRPGYFEREADILLYMEYVSHALEVTGPHDERVA